MATATKTKAGTDIYAMLKQDHQTIKSLFAEIVSGTGDRRRVFSRLRSELEAHTKAEERTIYRDLESAPTTHDSVLEAIEEHHAATLLLRELGANDPKTERWLAKAKVLREIVEHHVQEEEGRMFKKAQKVLDDAEAATLARRFETEKRAVTRT